MRTVKLGIMGRTVQIDWESRELYEFNNKENLEK